MLADPTLAPIEQKKTFGLWPPSKDNIADSLYPYIKRMKQEKVSILLVGDDYGEYAIRFLELDTANKIEYIHHSKSLGVSDEELKNRFEVREQNVKDFKTEKVVHPNAINKEYDIVFIDGETMRVIDDPIIKAFYDAVKSHGIFCGNDHHKTYVKDNLFKFRRDNRIGTPIHVSNRLCWFWIKR